MDKLRYGIPPLDVLKISDRGKTENIGEGEIRLNTPRGHVQFQTMNIIPLPVYEAKLSF